MSVAYSSSSGRSTADDVSSDRRHGDSGTRFHSVRRDACRDHSRVNTLTSFGEPINMVCGGFAVIVIVRSASSHGEATDPPGPLAWRGHLHPAPPASERHQRRREVHHLGLRMPPQCGRDELALRHATLVQAARTEVRYPPRDRELRVRWRRSIRCDESLHLPGDHQQPPRGDRRRGSPGELSTASQSLSRVMNLV